MPAAPSGSWWRTSAWPGPAIASLVINLLQIPALLLLVRDPGDIYLFAAYTLPFSLALVGYYFWYLQHHGILAFADVRLRLAGGGKLLSEAGRCAVIAGGAGGLQRRRHSSRLHPQRRRGRPLHHGLQADVHLDVVSGAMMNAYFPVLCRSPATRNRRNVWHTTSPP